VAQEYGDLTAKFVVKGQVPPAAKLTINQDKEVCGKHDLRDERVVVSKDGGLANVVIYSTPADGQKFPENPELKKQMPVEVVLDNANCRFSPRIVVVTTDQKLTITNSDPVGHNSKGDLLVNPSFNPVIPAKSKVSQTFAKPEKVPAGISCNIHPWMRAYLVVRDNPYTGVSDEEGRLKIEGIPVGEWSFTVWHETGYVQGQQNGKSLGWKRGKVTVKIEPGKETDLGTIEVPAESLLK
jgi:hypothetical protein